MGDGSATIYRVFVGVTPGLEDLLAEELREIEPGWTPRITRGGMELSVRREGLWQLAWRSRIAEQLKVRIGRFDARHFDELKHGASRLPWAAYLERGGTAPDVHVSCHKSRLIHSDAVAERVADVISERLGVPRAPRRSGPTEVAPGEETASDPGRAQVHVRLYHDEVNVSIDAAGERLHKRGWGTDRGLAPMRETLAAAILRAIGHRGQRPLWDPFCGAGTIPIEAAAAATGAPCPAGRSFGFEQWPSHDGDAYAAWTQQIQPPGPLPAPILGSDVDAASVEAARANAERAGMGAVRFEVADFEEAAALAPEGARILTNPPYGKRLGDPKEVAALYRRFGDMLRQRSDLREVHVVSGWRSVASDTRLPWRPVLRFSNRGIPVTLYRLTRR